MGKSFDLVVWVIGPWKFDQNISTFSDKQSFVIEYTVTESMSKFRILLQLPYIGSGDNTKMDLYGHSEVKDS